MHELSQVCVFSLLLNQIFSLCLTDFSMSKMLQNVGYHSLVQTDPLWDGAIQFVTERIGLDNYLLPYQCNTNSSLYQLSVNGWKDGKILEY